ncbi:hypothetical protein LshimejAT787_0312180 [Lyophyllum shimeji]|uniref:Uncharacterized protein n=1 Tax=Lyophyllum shimeji TaxID=47721 RepID=A0A9P3PK97_LYOSH|nr:hypothetical protein LshimejAT787_0312180 [Lyophyllum shimeji]
MPVVSLATNISATLLIFYRLWDHRKAIGAFAPLTNVSRAQKVMSLFVESGVVYCGIQLCALIACQLVPSRPQTGKDYKLSILPELSLSLAAIYPSVVVLLVNRQRSMVDTFGLSAELRNLASDTELPLGCRGASSAPAPP